jgi:hypothetical protein
MFFLEVDRLLILGKRTGSKEERRIELVSNELLIFLVIIRVINSFHVHFPIVDFIG